MLGYAVAIADTILAPFTPSNTARSGGTIYPVIRNLPALYDSKPNDPSARRIGSYVMWVAIAVTCVTSSMFLTALAPNLLALELVKKTAKIDITWTQWFLAFAPVGILLLLLIPLITYWIYPPEVKEGEEVPKWAGQELAKLGGLSGRESPSDTRPHRAGAVDLRRGLRERDDRGAPHHLAHAGDGVVTWDDIVSNKAAWNTLAWFATLVALADALNRVGFVKWFADGVAAAWWATRRSRRWWCSCWCSSSRTTSSRASRRTSRPPAGDPGGRHDDSRPRHAQFSLLLCLTLGIMGMLTPYATGPSPVYYGSGYLPRRISGSSGGVRRHLHRGVLVIGLPWMAMIK